MKALAVLAFALLMIGAVLQVDWPSWPNDDSDANITNEDVGKAMFGSGSNQGYALVLFLVGLLLLVALLGGIFLAKEEKE
jgi:NADH:ubiquinone oxidoreductase subunit 6 (subunit J)